ncbi:MAG TPA: ABC transporter ATP-binding protein [Chloroflexia bacterium]|nr:ABC transporter ATP-binding protein [Chloroflexia bacterium]
MYSLDPVAGNGNPLLESEPVYRIEHLTKRYGRGKALRNAKPANLDISLDIKAGEVFGLLGSNGAGKSTLIRQMVNLTAPSEGRILLMGQDIARHPEAVTRYVAYMPQKPHALLDLTAEEAVYYTGHMRGMAKDLARREAARLVEEWGLEAVRRKAVRHLSGGQHRLVSLAATLVGNLPVLILDEPTNELDPAFRKQVWEQLVEINRTRGTTIILVTHNVQEAERVIQRVAIMSDARVVGLGRVSELKAQLDQQVVLELFLRPESAYAAEQVLSNTPQAQKSRPNEWTVRVPRQGGEEAIHQILSQVQLARLEDFRVHTASLEDVYMQMTGHHIANEETDAAEAWTLK